MTTLAQHKRVPHRLSRRYRTWMEWNFCCDITVLGVGALAPGRQLCAGVSMVVRWCATMGIGRRHSRPPMRRQACLAHHGLSKGLSL